MTHELLLKKELFHFKSGNEREKKSTAPVAMKRRKAARVRKSLGGAVGIEFPVWCASTWCLRLGRLKYKLGIFCLRVGAAFLRRSRHVSSANPSRF